MTQFLLPTPEYPILNKAHTSEKKEGKVNMTWHIVVVGVEHDGFAAQGFLAA